MSELQRRSFLLRVKDCSQRLMPIFVHSAQDSGVVLNESVVAAADLCSQIEQCLFFGLVGNPSTQTDNLFFGFLELLDACCSPQCSALHASVLKVSSLASLHTPLGKARAWIREALNAKALDECLALTTLHPDLVAGFYNGSSMLTVPADYAIFLAVLRSLRVLPFNMTVDDRACNTVPIWLASNSHLPMSPRVSPPSSSVDPPSSSSSSSSSGSFRFFETGLTSLLNSAASMATKISSSSSSSTGSTNVSFFSTSLESLVLDSSRCPFTSLDPLLGIPSQAHYLLTFIQIQARTPGLFRLQPKTAAFESLKAAVEAEVDFTVAGACHPPPDVHTVVALLCEFLHLLPEPLLGLDHYAGLLECQKIEDMEMRIKNVALLVAQAPWYSQPLLVRLFSFLSELLQPENAEHNRLTVVDVSVLFGPFLLRKTAHLPQAGSKGFSHIMGRTSASISNLISFMITHQSQIFKDMRQSLEQRQLQLSEKCTAIKQVQVKLLTSTSKGAEVYNEDAQRSAAIQKLWLALSGAHKMRFIGPVPAIKLASFDAAPSRAEILLDSRWRHCGFPFPGATARSPANARNPLHDLSTFALTLLFNFITKHGPKSHKIVTSFATTREKYQYGLAKTANELIKQAALGLGLLEEREDLSLGAVPIARVSKLPSWALFSSTAPGHAENVLQVTFDLLLLSFDDSFLSLTTRMRRLPSAETGITALQSSKAILKSILNKGRPKSLNQLWSIWAEARIQGQVESANRGSVSGTAARSPSPHFFGEDDDEGEGEDEDDEESFPDEAEERLSLDLRTLRDPTASPKLQRKEAACHLPTNVIGRSNLLTRGQINALESSSPPYYQVRDWRLLFSIDLHGANLGTLIKKLEGAKASLIIIRERGEQGATFGGFIPCKLKSSEDFYGNSSSMVFTFKDGLIDVFSGTSGTSNGMYCFTHPSKGLGFGGGGEFSFWLDSNLNNGTSGVSETYGNTQLSFKKEYQVADMECYGLAI